MEKGQKMIDVVAAVIEQNGFISCFKKGQTKFEYLSHKYEFPGGKVEPTENHRTALKREIQEELETDIEVGAHLLTHEHHYPDFSIRLHFFACSAKAPIGMLNEHVEVTYLPPNRLTELDWLPADLPAVRWIEAHYGA